MKDDPFRMVRMDIRSKEREEMKQGEDNDERTRPQDGTPREQTFTIKELRIHFRQAFEAGAAFEREHQFMPPEIRPVKAAEEALARWPD